MVGVRALKNYLFKYPAAVQILKRVYKSRYLNNCKLFQKLILKRARHVDKGWTHQGIIIETAVTCNARCIMCAHSEKRMLGEMSMTLFKNIVDQLRDLGFRSVGLSIYGEPFMDRHWMERIEYLRSRDLSYGFFSNGSLLSQDVVESMVTLGGWSSVNFSVNGFSSSVYEEVMPPLKKERVYSNINMFLKRKQRIGTGLPHVSISFVQLKQNIAERRKFLKYWSAVPGVDRVILADCGDWLQQVDKDEIATKRTRGSRQGTWLAPCPSLWGPYYVYYDGRVAPCCEDAANRQLIIGDSNNTSLREIFYGKEIEALKLLHKNNLRSKHPICGKCHWNQPWI